MPADLSVQTLARDRERAAAKLEAAIVALGAAYRDYAEATVTLGDRVGADLTRRLEAPIVMHLVQAGLGGFLDRKLAGPVAPLRSLVEVEHQRIELLA